MILILLLSFISTSTCQESIFRLPKTILPTNYKLTLQPDIPNDNFNGIEFITIDIEEEYFNNTVGNFDVEFNYYPGMVISTARFYVNGTNTANYDLLNLDLDPTTQIATAEFDVPITTIQTFANAAGNIFTIYMEYTGLIRGGQDLAGWYKSIYTYNDAEIINLVTQFQATDARSAFPCFDEPAFKATFDITFIAPIDAVKLSNMPQIGVPLNVEGDCTWTNTLGVTDKQCVQVTFGTTPKMSTYLLAFVIGGYTSVQSNDGSEPPQAVYYPYTFEAKRAEFALNESIDILDLFGGSDGFDIPYSVSEIPKLDSIAVSDFAAGAMENWGLVVYRTVRLLVDDDISSQASKSGQILIIAHELAHQWFGNLVSPAWWDDLWLNEGFATYMAYYGGNFHTIHPEYNLNELKIQAITNVMEDDASVFTHSVKQEVDGDPTQILSSFSSITYQKGMGVINTIANVMGNDEFLNAINSYLTKYEMGVATSDDLGEELDAVESDMSELMNSFITQEGFPLIEVTTQLDGNDITFNVNQRRFVKQGPRFYDDPDSLPFVTQDMVDSFANQLWSVPMLWIDANGERIEIEGSEKYILTDRDIEFTIERAEFGDIEFYLANPVDRDSVLDGLFNFYRVKYDDFSFQLLIDNWLYIGTENQFVIISDRFALMQSGYVTPESFLDFIRDISDQMLSKLVKGQDIPDYPMFNAIIDSLIYIDDVFCELIFEGPTYSSDDKALRGYFRELSRDIVRRVLNLVVDNINSPFRDDHNECPLDSDCNILQAACLNALVRFNDRQIITRAYEWYFLCSNRVCNNPTLCYGCNLPIVENERLTIVTEDVLQPFISGVLSYDIGNSATLDEIINLYSMVNIEQQTYILNGLWAVYKSDTLITKALDFIMSETVRTNMKVNALVAVKQCNARNKLWQYVSDGEVGETVFDQLFEGSGLFSQEPLTALANTFASAEKEAQVSTFFGEGNRVNPGTQRIVNQTLENIYSRGLWKEDSQPELQIYLRTYIVDKLESGMEIWQVVALTLGCCLALVCLVIAFWYVSKPNESDRVVYYLSKKRERRRKQSSSVSHHGAGQLTSSLGQSLDRTLRNKTDDDTKAQDKNDELAISGNTDIVEEQQNGQKKEQYGSTDGFDYNQYKNKDDQQT